MSAESELRITRIFDAPRALVWRAWTDPELAKQWMGPRGFACTEFIAAAGVGSHWHMKMHGQIPGTEQMAILGHGGRVLEFDPPRRLVYTLAWDDRAACGLPSSPFAENVVTIEFEESNGRTVMTFRQGPFATESECNGHTGGWNSSFDRFAEFLLREQPAHTPPADEVPTEWHLRRSLAASRQQVFDAWTTPELLAQWWGPEGFTNPVCEVEPRSGGAILIHMQAPDGATYTMDGRFVELYPPYRFHFVSSPISPSGRAVFEAWNSVFLGQIEGQSDQTELVLDIHVTQQTAEAPEYLRGMRKGWDQSLAKLGRLVTNGAP